MVRHLHNVVMLKDLLSSLLEQVGAFNVLNAAPSTSRGVKVANSGLVCDSESSFHGATIAKK